MDVENEVMSLLKFESGAIGSVEATRNAWGRNNFITVEIHGSEGSVYFNYENRDELQVCFKSDGDDCGGVRTGYTMYLIHSLPHPTSCYRRSYFE